MSFFTDFLPKKENKEYYLILGIENHSFLALIIQIAEGKTKIIGWGKSEFQENSLEAADLAISQAEKNLPEEILVKKTVFILPSEFVSEEKIKPEFLSLLKNIAKELELSPLGFLEYPLIVSSFLEKEEGSPQTFLFLHFLSKTIQLSLIRVGKIQKNFILEKGENLGSSFLSSLSHFKSEILPSRILLYRLSDNLENFQEELMRIPWHKNPSFLHTPKIEIFSFEKMIKALAEVVASSFLKKSLPLIEEREPEEKKPSHPFVEKEKKEPGLSQTFLEEDFGFQTKSDLQEISHAKADNFLVPEENWTGKKITPKRLFTSWLSNFSQKIFPKIKEKIFFPPSFLLWFFLILLLPLGGIFFFLFFSYPKVRISLFVLPSSFQKEIGVVFTSSPKKITSGKNFLLLQTLSEEISGTKSAVTTGKNKIGEKARGEVTIYNKTLNHKVFPKGTILESQNWQFILEEEVSVASASETGEGLTFGKGNVKVSALNIGPEGNLPAGQTFIFKDFPPTAYIAKNLQAFSGGFSREVSSVSKEDQTKLEESLTQEILTKARFLLSQKLTSEQQLLPFPWEKTVVNKKFSSPVGSEAKELTLSLTLKITAPFFSQSDFLKMIDKDSFLPPEGFSFLEKKISLQVEDLKKEKNGEISGKVLLTIPLMPKIDQEEVKKALVGKSYEEATNYFKKINNIIGFKIVRENQPLFPLQKLPAKKENITLNLAYY